MSQVFISVTARGLIGMSIVLYDYVLRWGFLKFYCAFFVMLVIELEYGLRSCDMDLGAGVSNFTFRLRTGITFL